MCFPLSARDGAGRGAGPGWMEQRGAADWGWAAEQEGEEGLEQTRWGESHLPASPTFETQVRAPVGNPALIVLLLL